MEYFTKEETELLGKYEEIFFNVVYNSYKKGTTEKANNEIATIYENRTGDSIQKAWGCSRCVYNAWWKIGKHYFNSKAHWENEVRKESEPSQQNNNEIKNQSQDGKQTSNKKSTRKTKSNKE